MDFNFNDEQNAVREAVTGIFAGLVDPGRVKEVEASEDRVDADLWAELARADLLGLAVPEAYGGGGFGMVELCLLLEAQGSVVAPVPTLNPLLPVTLVVPLRLTAPVPVAKLLLPEIAVGPFKLTAPVPVLNVPVPLCATLLRNVVAPLKLLAAAPVWL